MSRYRLNILSFKFMTSVSFLQEVWQILTIFSAISVWVCSEMKLWCSDLFSVFHLYLLGTSSNLSTISSTDMKLLSKSRLHKQGLWSENLVTKDFTEFFKF